MKNCALLDALSCKNKGAVPIWLMRQAGRYMPDYRALKSRYTLLEMFHTPQLIEAVTLLPVHQLGVDAAILFSDILIILDNLNKKWHFEEGKGPIIEDPIKATADVESLFCQFDAERFTFLKSSIQSLKAQLNIPLIGFCGAPFTIASYLIEGGSSKELKKTKKWMYTHPESFHALLNKLSLLLADFLNFQIRCGVDAVQIFDSWANSLSLDCFKEFCLPYMDKIIKGLPNGLPSIIFCRGSSFFAEEMASIKPHAISLDWQAPMSHIRKNIPHPIALQGNLDPLVLLADRTAIKIQVDRIMKSMANDSGFIFNLGHGILPETPLENVQFLVNAVKNYVS